MEEALLQFLAPVSQCLLSVSLALSPVRAALTPAAAGLRPLLSPCAGQGACRRRVFPGMTQLQRTADWPEGRKVACWPSCNRRSAVEKLSAVMCLHMHSEAIIASTRCCAYFFARLVVVSCMQRNLPWQLL